MDALRWRPSKNLYWALVLVRLLVALSSTSTIHPDEHFQNPEVAASLVLDYSPAGDGPLLSWEWVGEHPCRSIVPVYLSLAWVFELVRTIARPGEQAHPQHGGAKGSDF